MKAGPTERDVSTTSSIGARFRAAWRRLVDESLWIPFATFLAGALWIVANHIGTAYVEQALHLPEVLDEFLLVVLTTAATAAVVHRLARSQARYRLLADRSPDVIFRFRLLPEPGLEYVSPAVERLSGYPRAALYADPARWTGLVHPEDRARLDAAATDGEPVIARLVRADGTVRWTEHRTVTVRDRAGRAITLEGSVRDVTTRELARRALEASERRLCTMLDNIDLVALMLDPAGRITYANPALLDLTGWPADEIVGRSWFESLVPAEVRGAALATFAAAMASGDLPAHTVNEIVTRAGTRRRVAWSNTIVRAPDGSLAGTASIGENVTEREASALERERLVAAVEQTGGSVIITAPDGVVEYVNRAFSRISGYTAREVVGRHPRDVLASGVQPASFWAGMGKALSSGRRWSGEWVLRRKSGSLYREQVMIAPVRDRAGTIVNYVATARDVTHEREVEATLEREIREQAEVAAALMRLQPGETTEATADAICAELLDLEGVDAAVVIEFCGPDEAVTLGFRGPPGFPLVPGVPLPVARARHLMERAGQGPWTEDWHALSADDAYGELVITTGFRVAGYAPLRNGDGLLGVIVIGTRDPVFADHLIRHLPIVVEFAAHASALLAPRLEARGRDVRRRAELDAILARRQFYPVFQPIVDLATGRTVGYEALTRFLDRRPPDEGFREAWAVGRGVELEIATLEAALAVAADLPAGAFLDLNVSPRLLGSAERVRDVLGRATRAIVVEVTEHEPVADYAAFRAAIASLGAGIRVAVDDAGAGEANFAHIVELRPDFVKLDIRLVRGIDTDLGRQALVLAMRHFARATGCDLVAEGVETAAEAAKLVELGVPYAQGYHFGFPVEIGTLRGA